MNIIIDAMGGDHAPSEIVKGALIASEKTKSTLVLVGDKARIESCLKEGEINKNIPPPITTANNSQITDLPIPVSPSGDAALSCSCPADAVFLSLDAFKPRN
ncbi:MAG: hypothetical protein IIX83_04850 [Peptococcaceae bacterium]|nr:hypothetical protein [Peptococcaceae bacterium]